MPVRVMIVEDHPDSREILRIQIEYLGYKVIEALSGEEALEKALVENPDLIIMDIMLPGQPSRLPDADLFYPNSRCAIRMRSEMATRSTASRDAGQALRTAK